MHPATTELGESLSTLFWGRHMNVTGQIKAFDLLQSRYAGIPIPMMSIQQVCYATNNALKAFVESMY